LSAIAVIWNAGLSAGQPAFLRCELLCSQAALYDEAIMSDALISRYIDSLWLERGLSDHTLNAYRRDLAQFAQWLTRHNAPDLADVTAVDLQAYLGDRLQQGGSPRTAARFLSSVRSFYRWLVREGVIVDDPTVRLESPR
jgi:integrase/recombinase XerD